MVFSSFVFWADIILCLIYIIQGFLDILWGRSGGVVGHFSRLFFPWAIFNFSVLGIFVQTHNPVFWCTGLLSLITILFFSRDSIQKVPAQGILPIDVPEKSRDPWEDGDCTYVYFFRQILDEFALTLGAYTRWHQSEVESESCAQIVSEERGVLARINVHGNDGSPYEAIIKEISPLTPDQRNALLNIFALEANQYHQVGDVMIYNSSDALLLHWKRT